MQNVKKATQTPSSTSYDHATSHQHEAVKSTRFCNISVTAATVLFSSNQYPVLAVQQTQSTVLAKRKHNTMITYETSFSTYI